MTRRLAALVITAALLAPSCGGDDAATTTTTTPGPTGFHVSGFAFKGLESPVAAGSTVTVTNDDPVQHTFTFLDPEVTGTGPIEPGTDATFTAPDAPGAYEVICEFHGAMSGKVTVE